MNFKPFICLAFILSTTIVRAEALFIDYQWKQVFIESCMGDACLERAKETLVGTGFQLRHSGQHEVVGTKGDYKGVVACIGKNDEIMVFIVGGPNYEQAKRWAIKMKDFF